ncbi:MAG: ABC transporter permease [Chlamydiia bacterium]|nr:ABC transporter permease [Chlamydiia bacterium]
MKRRMRRLNALIIKEFFQIIRDPSAILISLFLPLLLLFLYGYGVSLDLNHLRLGLVIEDNSKEAYDFASGLVGSPYFELVIKRHRHELEEELIKSNIRGYVVIPEYFSKFFLRNEEPAPLQIIADGSEPNTAAFAVNYVTGVWEKWLQQQKISSDLKGFPPLANFQPRYWFNEQLESQNFLIPGSLAIIMTIIGTLLTALVVAREWERGTMESLMSTPVTNFELIMGKLIPYYLLAFVSMTICIIFAVGYYGIPFRGSYFTLWLVTTAFLFPALGLGLFASTLAKDQVAASQAAIFAGFLPAFMLSGFIFEIASMPLPIRLFTRIWPARYFVSSLQTLFLAGNIWPILFFNMAWMIGIGIVFYIGVNAITVKRLD